jgi:hypothetical protein
VAAPLVLLGIGALTHIVIDPVNLHPGTLFWPLFGTTFPDARGYLWVFPITLEIVLIIAIFLTSRRSEAVRARISTFVEAGAV